MKAVVFTPGFLWGQIGEVWYKQRVTVRWATFWESKRSRVILSGYVATIVASSIRHLMERSHWVITPQRQGVDVGGGGFTTYMVSFPRILSWCIAQCQDTQKRLAAQVGCEKFYVYTLLLEGYGAAGGE